MTREEAIGLVKSAFDAWEYQYDTGDDWSREHEARDMAIKALEKEPILDKIRAEIEELIEWHDCPVELDGGNDLYYCEACKLAIEIIDKYKIEGEE